MEKRKRRPKLKRFDAIVEAQKGPDRLPAMALLDTRIRVRCWACRCPEDDFLQIHHLVPRSKGGGDELTNLALLCGVCHDEVPDGFSVEDQIQWCLDRELYLIRRARFADEAVARLQGYADKYGVRLETVRIEEIEEAYDDGFDRALAFKSAARESQGWFAVEMMIKAKGTTKPNP